MTSQFIEVLETFETLDLAGIHGLLVTLEELLRRIQFSETEWNLVVERLTSKLVPILKDNVKSFDPDLMTKALDLFADPLIKATIGRDEWSCFYNLAIKIVNSDVLNCNRIGGLKIIQALISSVSANNIPQFNLNNLVRSLRNILCQSQSRPKLKQYVNSTLGLLCKQQIVYLKF